MTRVPALRDLNTSTHYQRCVYFGIFGFLIVERTPGVLWSWYIFFGLRPNHFTWKCHSCECKRSSRSFWGVQPLEVWCNDVFPCSQYFQDQCWWLLLEWEHLPSHHPIPCPSPLQACLLCPFPFVWWSLPSDFSCDDLTAYTRKGAFPVLAQIYTDIPFSADSVARYCYTVTRYVEYWPSSFNAWWHKSRSHSNFSWSNIYIGLDFLEYFMGTSGPRFRVPTWLELYGLEIDWWIYWKIKVLLHFDVV